MLRGPEYLNSQRKRDLDVIGGGLLALTLGIPAALSAAAIYLEDPAESVIFRQMRKGRRGDEFEIVKLRTLRSELTCGNPYRSQGIVDDRALRIGSVLRW